MHKTLSPFCGDAAAACLPCSEWGASPDRLGFARPLSSLPAGVSRLCLFPGMTAKVLYFLIFSKKELQHLNDALPKIKISGDRYPAEFSKRAGN